MYNGDETGYSTIKARTGVQRYTALIENLDGQTFPTIYSRFLRLRVRAADALAGAGVGAGADAAASRARAGFGAGAALGRPWAMCEYLEAAATTAGCWVARVLGRGLRCGCGLLAPGFCAPDRGPQGRRRSLGRWGGLTLGAALVLGAGAGVGGGDGERGRNIICASGPGVPMLVCGVGSGMCSSCSSSSSCSASESAAAEASAAELSVD
ncbi:hypothetical protein BKA62DRAFT_273245 [Auriculariales sp. MPI-PUGE-AT-0066]|nr:hypothetical protein BKA62DRAFT_273245 [Auriculariales sp. MPI-PUGE-AT-0066]